MGIFQRWKRTSLPNKLLVITGGIVALGTLYQSYILHISLEQNTIGLKENIQSTRNDQRAWIAIESMGITQLEAGESLKAEIKIVDTGKTIALNVRHHGAIQTSLVPLDIDKFEQSKDMPPQLSSNSIGALFQNIDVIMSSETSVPINLKQVEAIKDRRLLVYLFGEINYDDIFRIPHTTQFCGMLVPATGRFESCAQHDKVD